MSSRLKGKGNSSRNYPTQWSEWVWSEAYQRHYRSRLKGPDDWEYEYEQPEDVPRTFSPLDPRSEGSSTIQYPSSSQSSGYATAPLPSVDDVTQESSQTAYEPYSLPTPSWQNHIKTRDPCSDREEFDPHYEVHGSWAFKWGRIFEVLWAEPRGADREGSSTGNSGTESLTIRKGANGTEAFVKVRRFVIIKPMEGHCICLPISTYSGQGVNKRGVHADHHAIIYSGRKPVAFRGEKEKGLVMKSIKITPDNPRHIVDDASRLNYAKTYTVEYNVKVWFIGKVSSDSEWQVRTDYNRVHPPLEIKGVRPADTLDDTYYATGGESLASTNYYPGSSSSGTYYGRSSNAFTATYPSSSYGSSFSLNPAYGAGYGTYGSYSDVPANTVGYTSPYFPHLPPDALAEHSETPGHEPTTSRGHIGVHNGQSGAAYDLDPGDDLRAPGDSDDTGDQRDGDRAGGQRKSQGY
ncbi:hypothetical protein BGZ57DRAFT_912532 [Hyaloscypha finlandica]|nr:hypothetical protein BGZ57DRAFT_912532 [Hyaloscypha finlandica]